MADEMNDEFGNYVGPELESDDEPADDQQVRAPPLEHRASATDLGRRRPIGSTRIASIDPPRAIVARPFLSPNRSIDRPPTPHPHPYGRTTRGWTRKRAATSRANPRTPAAAV
jgi:hypothetical protein